MRKPREAALFRKLQLAAVVMVGFTGSLAAPAQAGVRQDFSLGFTTNRAAADTGLTLHVLYKNPADPNAKPPALTSLVIQLPVGTAFHTADVTVCTASDAQLEIEGPSACPGRSHLTTGTFTAMTGIPPLDPFVAPDEVFNGGDRLIEDVVFPHTQTTAGIDHLQIRGSTLTANPPDTPGGPPDGRTVPRQIDVSIPAYGRFIQTPSTCPSTGEWTATSAVRFADGGSETDTSIIRCVATASGRSHTQPPHHGRHHRHRRRHRHRHHGGR